MRLDFEDVWTDAVVTIAVFALPFYLGYVHAPIDSLFEYALVAGVSLALAERLVYNYRQGDGLADFAANAALRGTAVLIWGGASFGLAMWLV